MGNSVSTEASIPFSRVSGGPFHALLARLGLVVTLLLISHSVLSDDKQTTRETTYVEDLVSEALADTPYINSLLIERDFPYIGGSWGWEMFVDVPLNGEPDGAEITLRRAKAKYARRFGEHWRFKLTGDYSQGGGLELSDSYFSYSGWDRKLLTLGITDPPFSLESIDSSSALTFMERGLPVVALSERRSGGVTILRRSPKSIINAALILFNVTQDNIREEGQGIVLHYAHSPIEIVKGRSVHLGGSFSYRVNANEDSTQFRTRPEIATVNDYYVDTGPIANASEVGRVSLEASHVAGRFSWQSELLATRVRRHGMDDVEFWGAYLYASWFLTEDTRNYNFGSGSFEQVTVNSPMLEGGKGAWELAVRASYVDLTDQDVIGGKQKNLSLGLNWYLNQRIRLMTNLIKVLDVDRPGSEYDGQDPLIFSMRVQWVLN
jgi:phosphate-selective porin OprO/OprP